MIWFISDTHFGHRQLQCIDYGGRPNNFDALLCRNTTNVFSKHDTLVHVGDVYIGQAGKDITLGWLRNLLPCTKVLIRGNHDRESHSAYLRYGWDAVMDGAVFTAYGKSFLVTHIPMIDVPPQFTFNLHGHLHNSSHRGELVHDGRHILLSPEHCNYRPVSIKTLARLGSTPMWKNGRWEKFERKELVQEVT